jgi:hypothetical protein
MVNGCSPITVVHPLYPGPTNPTYNTSPGNNGIGYDVNLITVSSQHPERYKSYVNELVVGVGVGVGSSAVVTVGVGVGVGVGQAHNPLIQLPASVIVPLIVTSPIYSPGSNKLKV